MRLVELQTRHMVGAVQGAAGNKEGAKAADKISFLSEKRRKVPSVRQAVGGFGEPLIDGAELVARANTAGGDDG